MSDGIDDNPSNPSVDGNRHNNITTTIIPRDYFITSAKPNGLSRPDKNNLHARSEWEKTYDLVKSEINNQLIESFVLAAQEKRFSKHPVTKLYHIGQAWKTDASKKDDYAHICYGHFKKGWEKNMEEKVMANLHTTYDNDSSSTGKTSIARLCMMKRTEIVSNWNRLAKKSHGSTCSVTRPHNILCDADKKVKFAKRREGTYYFNDTIPVAIPSSSSSPEAPMVVKTPDDVCSSLQTIMSQILVSLPFSKHHIINIVI